MRTSNCYLFTNEKRPQPATISSKSNLPPGTGTQVFNSDLFAALDRFKGAFEKATGSRSGWKASASS
jgi:hypothetical protein